MDSDTSKTPRTKFGKFHITKEPKGSEPITTAQPHDDNISATTETTFEDEPNDAISNLPTEIGLQIFSVLDPVTAICLGLTNRKMYSFYLSHHNTKVVLNQYVVVDGEVLPLHRLMKDWGVEGWVYDGYCPGRFVRGTEMNYHEREKYVKPQTPDPGLAGVVVNAMLWTYSKWRGWR